MYALAAAYAAQGDESAMRDSVERLRSEARGDPSQLASAMVLLGRLEVSLGNTARGIRAMREAYELGADPGVLGAACVAALLDL